MQTNSVIKYKINSNDEIVFVSSSWDQFAEENDAPGLILENLLNRSLWDFISDETTCQLYKEMLSIVRTGKAVRFNFNCDSPDEIRLWEMVISPDESGSVVFYTRPLSEQERPLIRLLDRKTLRTSGVIQICAWCKMIDTGVNHWKSLEEGISVLGLFERQELPQLSHGICDNCYTAMSEKISQRKKMNFTVSA